MLLTKLYRPQLAPGLLQRPALLRLMDRALSHKVTLVSTPPGYGKSTLVSQWLNATSHPSAWVSFDQADNDPETFVRYVLAAIEEIDDSLAAATRRLVQERRGLPVSAIIESLIGELAAATRPFVLVFDDFHAIEAPEILEGLNRLMTYAPPALRLVLVSRTDPRLPLMRMRARGELFELRTSDLAFTPDETRALLCDAYALPIDDDQLAVLQTWSEGWPLGLILVGHALQERARESIDAIIDRFAHNPDFIADYLWRELLQRQPEGRQQFLLQTSILDQFNAQLCNAVIGHSDAGSMLAAVAEENLFLIPLGERKSWFRYHHLFQDMLREWLAQARSHDEIRELHLRAAYWYREEGLVEEAATHAIRAQQWELAIQVLRPVCHELYRLERLSRVCFWLDQLPDEVVKADPLLSFQYAWSLIRLGRPARGRVFIEAAEAQWTAAGDQIGIGRIQNYFGVEDYFFQNTSQGIERCQLSLKLLPDDNLHDRARTFTLLGNLYAQAGELAKAEAALVKGRLLARQIGNVSLQLAEMNASAICLHARGELPEAETLYQRAIATGNEWHDLPVVYAQLLLGSLYLDQYRLHMAEQTLERALELADRLSGQIHLIRIHGLLARLAWTRHDAEIAFAEIDRSIAAGGSGGLEAELRHTRAKLAYIWLRQGKHNLARAWAAELDLNLDQPPPYLHVDEYLVALELIAHDGQIRRALTSLDLSIAHAQEHEHRHNLLDMLLLKCVLLTTQGKATESDAALDAAIAIAAGPGYVWPFLAFASELEPRLQELNMTSKHARYVRHLLELMRSTRQQIAPSEESTNRLSKRQAEIMQLVAAGHSNRDIATQLFISEQTVKKHLSTTFARLGVSSRTQAIEACRRMNIL